MIISIDGPAASGKSTVAKQIAEQLGLLYIDTGAMYRAVALYLQKERIDTDDFLALESALDKVHIEFRQQTSEVRPHTTETRIFLNNQDVSEAIRMPEITKLSSEIATKGVVRQRMVEMQRKMALNQDVILDGRDIGTVVFPDADFKYYLTASLEARALRRFKELKDSGINTDLEDIKQDLIWRDQNDSNRAVAPLKKAEDAIEINNTKMSIKDQVNYIIKHIRRTFA